jgi:hypothetical protein
MYRYEMPQRLTDPIVDVSDQEAEIMVTATPKRRRVNPVCGVCRNAVRPVTRWTKHEDLLAWIRPCKCDVYHLGCLIKRLPVPAGINDPWRKWEYHRCPEKWCMNKPDSIVYKTVNDNGTTSIRMWYEAPPPKPEPFVAFDKKPGWVPLRGMR